MEANSVSTTQVTKLLQEFEVLSFHYQRRAQDQSILSRLRHNFGY